LDALSQNEKAINLAYLKQFDEYKEFQSGSKNEKTKAPEVSTDELTPSELIEFWVSESTRGARA